MFWLACVCFCNTIIIIMTMCFVIHNDNEARKAARSHIKYLDKLEARIKNLENKE